MSKQYGLPITLAVTGLLRQTDRYPILVIVVQNSLLSLFKLIIQKIETKLQVYMQDLVSDWSLSCSAGDPLTRALPVLLVIHSALASRWIYEYVNW
jgi:hypothetical protein